MTDPPTIASLFRDAAKLLRARFEVIRTTNPHAGEKGAEVEDILKQFLNEHLPQRFRAGSGIVLDADNTLSRQQDVIIYDALSSPLYRFASKTQIVPMDAVVSVVEVKSRLTKEALADGYEKIASCKALKKREMSKEELRTNIDGSFHGTTGMIFAFDSAISLDTLLEHVKELNEQFDSRLWPEMVVVLDQGLISYAIQYPGGDGFPGSLMSTAFPPSWRAKGGPPWFVHLVLHRDGEFTLNRFFVTLLSQVCFFPVLSGVPPFKTILEGAPKDVMTRTGYQFDLSGQLRPAPEHLYLTDTNRPIVPLGLDVYAPNGARIAAMQFLPWQDGSVIRVFGVEHVVKNIGQLLRLPHDALLVVDPSVPNMWLTTITRITRAEFEKWPRLISKASNLRCELASGEQKAPDQVGRPKPRS